MPSDGGPLVRAIRRRGSGRNLYVRLDDVIVALETYELDELLAWLKESRRG